MRDPTLLQSLQQQLRVRKGANALFDTIRYARSFEAAVKSAWSTQHAASH
jgi:predicted O-linked N-acetylglucosamine transferase (SPINDLY family)